MKGWLYQSPAFLSCVFSPLLHNILFLRLDPMIHLYQIAQALITTHNVTQIFSTGLEYCSIIWVYDKNSVFFNWSEASLLVNKLAIKRASKKKALEWE